MPYINAHWRNSDGCYTNGKATKVRKQIFAEINFGGMSEHATLLIILNLSAIALSEHIFYTNYRVSRKMR